MKKNKKIWSWALAGALAVSNLSAVAMPLTAYAAAPSAASGNDRWTVSTLTGGGGTYAIGGEVVDVDFAVGIDLDAGSTLTLKATGSSGDAVNFVADSSASGANNTAAITISGSGEDETAKILNGKLTVHATKPETVTIVAEYDSNGATSGGTVISVASKTITVKQPIKSEALASIASLEGSSTAFTDQPVELTLAIDETKIPEGYFLPAGGKFYADSTNAAVNLTSIPSFDSSGLHTTDGVVWNATNPPTTQVTATAEGTMVIGVYYDGTSSASSADAEIATKTITVTDPSITDLSIKLSGDAKTLVSYDGNGKAVGGTEISVVATESYDYIKAAKDIVWEVFDAADTTFTTPLVDGGIFAINDPTTTPSGWSVSEQKTYEKSFTETAKVSRTSAALNAKAGSYVVAAIPYGLTEPVATYGFELVEYHTPVIQDDITNLPALGATIGQGDSTKLSLYYNDEYKKSDVTWTLATASDSSYVSIGDDGTATVKAYKTSGDHGVTINAVYKINSDIKTETVSYKITTKEAELTIKGATSVDVGKSATYTASFGGAAIDAKWSIANTSVATIDKNTGELNAIKASTGAVNITAEAVINGKNYKKTFPVTISPLKQSIYGEDGKAIPGAAMAVWPGQQIKLSLYEDGKPVTGEIEWTSADKNKAEVDSDGIVTIANLSTGLPTNVIVTAKVDGAAFGNNLENGTDYSTGITFTIDKANYVVKESKKTLSSTVAGTYGASVAKYSVSVFKDEILSFAVSLKNDAVDGIWAVPTDATSGAIVTVSGNTVTANAVGTYTQVCFYETGTTRANQTIDNAIAVVEVTVLADSFAVSSDDATLIDAGNSAPYTATNVKYTIASIEEGMSYSLIATFGIEDVTSNCTWKTTNSSIVSVSDGVITGEGIGNNAVITAEYLIQGGTPDTITIKVLKVASKSDTTVAAEEAAAAANEAADKAIAAAKAAEANPTAETVKAAQEAAAAATAAAKAAEEAADATSNTAAKRAAEEAAAAATAAAKTATDAATAAQAKVDEATKKAEEEKKAEEAAAQKAADQAVNATGTDAATGANYKVTDTAAKTVEFTGTSATGGDFAIPTTVTIDGDTFTVTKISANAFKGKSFKTITIGSNIKDIDPSAFSGCKAKTVKINGAKLTKSSVKALNKLKKGTKIKVTGKNKKANKKLIKKLKNVKNGKIKLS